MTESAAALKTFIAPRTVRPVMRRLFLPCHALENACDKRRTGNGLKPVNKKSQYLKAFEGQPGEVLDLATSGDRKLIATAGMFGEVRIYRIADRGRAATIGGITAPVYSVALNADGTRVAIGAANGTVSVYELATATLLKSLVPVPVEVAGTGVP